MNILCAGRISLKPGSRLCISNVFFSVIEVLSANIWLAITLGRRNHWSMPHILCVNRMDYTTEIFTICIVDKAENTKTGTE